MSITRLVQSIAVVMLVLSLLGAGFAIWSTQRSTFFSERITLAHESYEAHLKLSANTYRLFKQYGDAFLIGDRDAGSGEAALIGEVRANIAEIRQIITDEIDLVGVEEVEELDALDEIETTINRLIRELEQMREVDGIDIPSNNWFDLSRILDSDIDRDFQAMIDDALAEEQEEVDETTLAAERQASFATAMATGFALLAFMITAAALVTYHTRLAHPLRQLVAGVGRLAEGRFDHRFEEAGPIELSQVAQVMNKMAATVQNRTEELASQNARLETAVADRTSELQALLEQTQAAGAERRQMLADVSHELRTPLTIMQGESDVALRGGDKDPEDYREALRRVRDTARHTNLLVNDLLFISRQESGQTRLRLERTDLVEMARTAVTAFGADIPVLTDLGSAPAMVDRTRIRQSLIALTQNARQYGRSETIVRVDRTPSGWRIAVEDDGPGLSDDEKRNAFRRFYRGSNAADVYVEGAGLGLPVVRSIAEAHGGSARLEDRDGGGTVAILELPGGGAIRVAGT